MQKFLSLLFSRRALAVVGVLVLVLLVWFVGPLVSFDTLRPLASVGSRVVTIALLLMLLVLWLVNWSMSIIGISVLCLAIGFVTPLLALGDVHPFAPLWVRLTLIGFILLMYALYGLYRLWRALRMDEQLLRRFLHPRGEEVPVAGEIKADLRTVNHIVTQAIRQLRQLRVDMPGWRKIFEGKRFLYELPWFMVVGSPGDGKTTALLNTGLQFPLAEQMEQTSRILTVPGGGTLHCDWWFTNEAVLIDTAGRYARHDDGGEASAAQRNAGEWQGFLGLLRKHRPGAPLNGVILTLNVADLTATVTGGTPGGLRRSAGATGRTARDPGDSLSGLSGGHQNGFVAGVQRIFSHADQPSSCTNLGLHVAVQPQAKSGRPAGAARRLRAGAGAPDAAAGSGTGYPVTGRVRP